MMNPHRTSFLSSCIKNKFLLFFSSIPSQQIRFFFGSSLEVDTVCEVDTVSIKTNPKEYMSCYSVNCVERRGILVSGTSDANESRASHCNRLRFIAKGVRRTLDTEQKENDDESSAKTIDTISILTHLSKVWTCMKFYECSYDPALMSKAEMIAYCPN